jgi:hypothetical protein
LIVRHYSLAICNWSENDSKTSNIQCRTLNAEWKTWPQKGTKDSEEKKMRSRKSYADGAARRPYPSRP